MDANASPVGRSPPDSAVMETVRFDVSDGGAVDCDSSLRNITVARGSRETLPLNLFSDISSPSLVAVANFANAVSRVALLRFCKPRRQEGGPSSRTRLFPSGAARDSQ